MPFRMAAWRQKSPTSWTALRSVYTATRWLLSIHFRISTATLSDSSNEYMETGHMGKQLSSHAATAAAIRKEMKIHGIEGRVTSKTYSMGNSVTIRTKNVKPHMFEIFSAFAKQYQYGNFNGMIYMYEHSNDRDDIPQVKYVSIERQFDDELIQEAWKELRNTMFGWEDKYSEDYVTASGDYDVSNAVWRYITGAQRDFMFSKMQKDRIRV
jgi:hypothetical protein